MRKEKSVGEYRGGYPRDKKGYSEQKRRGKGYRRRRAELSKEGPVKLLHSRQVDGN